MLQDSSTTQLVALGEPTPMFSQYAGVDEKPNSYTNNWKSCNSLLTRQDFDDDMKERRRLRWLASLTGN